MVKDSVTSAVMGDIPVNCPAVNHRSGTAKGLIGKGNSTASLPPMVSTSQVTRFVPTLLATAVQLAVAVCKFGRSTVRLPGSKITNEGACRLTSAVRFWPEKFCTTLFKTNLSPKTAKRGNEGRAIISFVTKILALVSPTLVSMVTARAITRQVVKLSGNSTVTTASP